MQQKIKILHVQLLPLLSGVQRVSLNEITHLENEFDYSLVCSNEGPLTEVLSAKGIPCYSIPQFCRELSASKDLKSLINLFKLIRAKNFDVVHTHSSKTGVLGRIAAKFAGVPKVIHTVHGYAFPAATSKKSYYLYFFMEWLAKYFTDELIVLNEKDRAIAIEKLGYTPKRVHIIPNGVDTDKFVPALSIRAAEQINIIMVGRLWPQKDPKTLFLAVKKLLDENINITVTYVGDGELMEELNTLAANYSGKIIFLGWKDNIAEILPQHNLFVLPSLWEGMPLAILEAMSCGLPCLVTNIPGNNDLVKDGYNGFLFEVADHEKLSLLIKKYCQNPDVLLQHAENARSYVQKHYTLEARNKAVSKIYRG
ncbi:glycosyltransferase family 4 protein [Pseudescherichia sp.]|uniref:glycosyltransferase family 4 protein n=1 Tax=Pseudescherichia sp. TaxID=2055881 RepID=UPI00289C7013|nr:glycosyltransferase family 4 protein [Pseudescherichia sp.]